MSIASVWMNRIKDANPVLAAIGLGIAQQSAADPSFNSEAAVTHKLNEWKESADSQVGRALNYAVIYYAEDIAARAPAQSANGSAAS